MNTQQYTFSAEDTLHIKDLGDGIVGDGLVHIARDALGLSLAMLKHTSAYLRCGSGGVGLSYFRQRYSYEAKRKQFIQRIQAKLCGRR